MKPSILTHLRRFLKDQLKIAYYKRNRIISEEKSIMFYLNAQKNNNCNNKMGILMKFEISTKMYLAMKSTIENNKKKFLDFNMGGGSVKQFWKKMITINDDIAGQQSYTTFFCLIAKVRLGNLLSDRKIEMRIRSELKLSVISWRVLVLSLRALHAIFSSISNFYKHILSTYVMHKSSTLCSKISLTRINWNSRLSELMKVRIKQNNQNLIVLIVVIYYKNRLSMTPIHNFYFVLINSSLVFIHSSKMGNIENIYIDFEISIHNAINYVWPLTNVVDFILDNLGIEQYKKNYIANDSTFPSEIWAENIYSIYRATNACESFHSKFNSQFYFPHPIQFQYNKTIKERN
ncbi:hypothetical protein AGLY_001353 [Aphis glycines]|uniref:MULE transposase domain-containing protein n=1 Tax=Aphis glycines TaxID=307491 RepID=A0A6G0U519_APHGL|nr:hypothetical protein AGLY_001353 [Aphis glycines]